MQYVAPPPDINGLEGLCTKLEHDEVTAVLNALGVPGSTVSRHHLGRILVENADDVIHVLSFYGEFLYLSPSCKNVLEYDPTELGGKALATICHPSDIGPVLRELRSTTTSAPVTFTYRIQQKYTGYMWFECHGAWHIDPFQGRTYFVAIGRPRPLYSFPQIFPLGPPPL